MGTLEDRLRSAGCVAADEEAAALRDAAPDPRTLASWARRRERGEPLAWITGTVSFCGRTLAITPGVYVPRPQTEDLARRAAARLPTGGTAADLCTGCGAVAAHLVARDPVAKVVGTDVDLPSVADARRNGVAAVAGDLGSPLRSGEFDVVTVVAPYVPTPALRLLPRDVQRYEPRLALDGGPDGLGVVRRAIGDAARLLRPDGWLLIELGDEQHVALTPALAAAGFRTTDVWSDDEGDLRGIVATRST